MFVRVKMHSVEQSIVQMYVHRRNVVNAEDDKS